MPNQYLTDPWSYSTAINDIQKVQEIVVKQEMENQTGCFARQDVSLALGQGQGIFFKDDLGP